MHVFFCVCVFFFVSFYNVTLAYRMSILSVGKVKLRSCYKKTTCMIHRTENYHRPLRRSVVVDVKIKSMLLYGVCNCFVDIKSLDDVAALTETDVNEIRATYPMYVGMIPTIKGMLETEAANSPDQDLKDGVASLIKIVDILEDMGMFELQ